LLVVISINFTTFLNQQSSWLTKMAPFLCFPGMYGFRFLPPQNTGFVKLGLEFPILSWFVAGWIFLKHEEYYTALPEN